MVPQCGCKMNKSKIGLVSHRFEYYQKQQVKFNETTFLATKIVHKTHSVCEKLLSSSIVFGFIVTVRAMNNFSISVNMEKSMMLVIVLAVMLRLLIVYSLAYYETQQQLLQQPRLHPRRQLQQLQQQQPNGIADQRAAKPCCSQLKFAITLLNLLQKDKPNESIFYSPHSVYTTLLMAYFGSGGETEEELRQLLLLDGAESSKADVENAYILKNEQSNRFQNQSIEFISVEKLYILKGMQFR